MNRVIKFRAWQENNMIYQKSGMVQDALKFYKSLYYDLPPENIMQFTGEKDKNRNDIYEGDVVNIKNVTINEYNISGVVAFSDSTFCIKSFNQSEYALKSGYIDKERFWNDGSHSHYSLEMVQSSEIEVIGNVFQNKELLKNE